MLFDLMLDNENCQKITVKCLTNFESDSFFDVPPGKYKFTHARARTKKNKIYI